MNRRLSELAIVRDLAEKVCQRLTRKAIIDLQKMDSMLSGDDSGLQSIWDEICVQVQYEQSFSWQAYDATVHLLLDTYMEELAVYEREAVWLQTPEGEDWDGEDCSEREPYPVFDSDIVRYLKEAYVYAEAGRWSNPRIRAYIEQASFRD
jgi:hypothetical protein